MPVLGDNYIHLCKHCEARCSGVYCNDCKTAEQRKKMDEENKKIKPDYICRVCDLKWYSTFSKTYSDGLIEKK